MIDFAEYQSRLQQSLDERRDPLDDSKLQAFLEAHPEHLQAFAEQRSVLETIASPAWREQASAEQTVPERASEEAVSQAEPVSEAVSQAEPVAAAMSQPEVATGVGLRCSHAAQVAQPARRRWLPLAAAAALAGVTLFAAGWWAAHAFGGNTDGPGDGPAVRAQAAGTGRSRILSATLHEVAPSVRPAASYTVRDRLVKTPTMTLEAYEHRSELR